MNKPEQNKLLSIILPCFNEAENINAVVSKIIDLKLNYIIELVLVDDGSDDETWLKIKECNAHKKIKSIIGVQFTRNFGKEAAIEAGIKTSTGDLVIILDCDNQHPIDLIPKMIKITEADESIKIVNAVKTQRQKESLLHKSLAKLYFYIFNKLTGINIYNDTDFKLLKRSVVNSLVKLNEVNKFFRGLSKWTGYKSKNLYFTPNDRKHGNNSWSKKKLFSYAKSSILSFSYIPLKLISWTGFILFIFSIILGVDTVLKTINSSPAEGIPTIIILILFIGSIILFCLGIIGEYLAEIYKEIKSRPSYVINKKTYKRK